MPRAFAITTLHVCREPGEMKDGRHTKDARIEVVPAGQITDLTEEDYGAFEKAGAVRRPTRMDRARAEGGDEPDAVEAIAGDALAGDAARHRVAKPTQPPRA